MGHLEVRGDRIDPLGGESGLAREVRPRPEGIPYLADRGGRALDAEGVCHREEVGTGDVRERTVDTHQVLAQPAVVRSVGVRHVVRGGEGPRAGGVHEERDVLGVIVAVGSHHVECHPPERLFERFGAEVEFRDPGEVLGVVVDADRVEVEPVHSAQREHVQPDAVVGAVETPGHEVRATVLLEQACGRHVDAGGSRHQRVGVLHAPVVATATELLILTHAVELQQPRLEAGRGRHVTGPDLAGLGVDVDDRLGAGTARARPDLDDAAQGGL